MKCRVPIAIVVCLLFTQRSHAENNLSETTKRAACVQANSLFDRAVLLRKQGYETTASRKELLQQAIALCPDKSIFYANLAEECRLQSNFPEALDAASKAVKLDRNNSAA